MEIIYTVREVQDLVNKLKRENKTIGFVPTMGYLHKGHISLVKASKEKTDVTIVSIFVNPTQFAPSEDFSKYPRDLEKDKSMLLAEGVDYIFYPTAEEIYPKGFQTYVDVEEITKQHEGEFRPTHFKGVTTIVSILFNCVKPDYAFFGQKDAQQATVLKRMVKDLKYDIEVVICEIIREEDGLALSSRNIFLSPTEREKALLLHKSLSLGKELISKGERNTKSIIKQMNSLFLLEQTIHLNYIRIVDSENFNMIDELIDGSSYFILIACRVGNTRLIDNFLIKA